MNVLVACEESQTVCKSFREKGHDAYSCDIQECSGGHPEWHIQDDAIKVLYSREWDLVIAHPPCKRLSNSGVRWLSSKTSRPGYTYSHKTGTYLRSDPKIWQDFYDGCIFFKKFLLYGKTGGRIAIENPIQHQYAIEEIGSKYSQIIQPWQFGHTTTKATCLWLYGLPPLTPTRIIPKEQRTNEIWLASPGPDRAKIRSKTFTGIAKAMAEQWG